jgi:uncharacterized membrane protein
MAAFLGNLRNVVIAGFVLAGLAFLLYLSKTEFNGYVFWPFVMRWLHIASGVMWIGLLWYFNFVSTPTMPNIPDELKPALGRYITPAALFWFRWAAMSTLVFGVILAYLNGNGMDSVSDGLRYIAQIYTIDALDGFTDLKIMLIGIGVWLATIMWFNVWFVIWPNQQRALNIDNAYPDLAADAKAKAARTAGQASRINTMLSIPMLFCMVAATHIFTG